METWAAASLRIGSSELTAEEIGLRLGLSPTAAFEMGSLMSPRNPASRRRSEHLWVLDSGVSHDTPMSDHLAALHRVLEPRREAFRSLGNAVRVDLFLGWHQSTSQGTFALGQSMLRLLGDIGATVTLDIHGE